MSRAFLITLERLAFMTVLVISRMIDSMRLEMTDSRMGSKLSTVAPRARTAESAASVIFLAPPSLGPGRCRMICDHAICDAMIYASPCQRKRDGNDREPAGPHPGRRR